MSEESEQMPHDVEEQPQQQAKRFEPKQLPRRGLFKGALAGLGGAVLTRGVNLSSIPEDAEYAFKSGPVRFFMGTHHISPQSDQVEKAFYKTGDLRLSQWDDSTVGMIDRSMRESRQKGRPYFMTVDSSSASVTQHLMLGGAGEDENSASYRAEEFSAIPPDWLLLPHPDLSKKENYPDNIYLIEADLRSDYGLGDIPNSENYYTYLTDMEQSLNTRYFQKSRPEIVKEAEDELTRTIPEKLTEGVIAASLFAAGLPDTITTRRKVLKIAALLGAGVFEAGKGLAQGNVQTLAVGKLSDPDEQKLLTALTSAVDWKFADTPDILWTLARTALAVEKAQEIAGNPDPSLSKLPIQIDLLYGSAHNSELARIMQDQSFRHQLIAKFLSDILLQIDVYISEYKGIKGSDMKITESDAKGHKTTETIHEPSPFGELRSIRNDLFKAAANSMLSYKISEVHMPWGKKYVPPDDIDTFEKNLVTDKVVGEVQSLKPVVRDVLHGFGIKD